jgi:putative transposase
VKYAFIHSQRKNHKIARLCLTLGVSTSGYYDWLDRPESARAVKNKRLKQKILAFYQASRCTYGSPRIHRDLLGDGESISVNKVARLMNECNIKSKMAKKFVITTDSKNTLKASPDRIKRHFNVVERNKAWVSDTTFIPTQKGWLYLAVVLDLFSRQVIGWSMSDKNNAQLVQDALTMAIGRRGKVKNVIVHSDQGSTYASNCYQTLLKQNQLICSMSRKGECLDNAVAESFFGTLKTELVDDERYRNHSEAKQSLFEYIEIFYNRYRRHSYLDYISPAEFECRNVS